LGVVAIGLPNSMCRMALKGYPAHLLLALCFAASAMQARASRFYSNYGECWMNKDVENVDVAPICTGLYVHCLGETRVQVVQHECLHQNATRYFNV